MSKLVNSITSFLVLAATLSMALKVPPIARAGENSIVFPSRKYTAEYENFQSNDNRGPERRLISCNGNGMLIYEWNKLKFLYDAHKQLENIIDPREKIINIHRSNLNQTGGEWLDEDMFLQLSSESISYKKLGEEKIADHNCRVYVNAESEKLWYDTKAKVLVFRKFEYGAGSLVTKLLKYSSHALPTKEFELPNGYEIRDSRR